MINSFLILSGKAGSYLVRMLKLGHGSTWPGHIALFINKDFISDLLKESNLKVIVVAGTNGKTTTTKLIRTMLEANGKRVIQNHSGANLLNGLASSLILHAETNGTLHADYALFEVDENTLSQLLSQVTPDYMILLNLFRDQLDRYGEVNTIAKRWKDALEKLPESAKLLLNADDPLIAYLGTDRKNVLYFGLSEKGESSLVHEHAVDSVHCPKCGEKLDYNAIFFSHLGIWSCPTCHFSRPRITPVVLPKNPLRGKYNEYNLSAAIHVAHAENVGAEKIAAALASFEPAFGRQEMIEIAGKNAQIFLSKNPTGFNESLRTIVEANAKHVLLILNDRIPDGRDVSWIWDVDFEKRIRVFDHVTISGDRCYDLALRIKYSEESDSKDSKLKIQENLKRAIYHALEQTPDNKTLYILPTYTAMLETRKILTGRHIL